MLESEQIFMLSIVKQEIEIEEALKKKLEFICSFCNIIPIIQNGSIRKIEVFFRY